MKTHIFRFAVLLLLFCPSASGQDIRLEDPDKLLSKKEKEVFEKAIKYEMDFFNRVFSDKVVNFSDMNFTLIPNYMSYILYQSQGGGTVHQSSGYYSPSKCELVICKDEKYKSQFLITAYHELSHAFLHLHAGNKYIPAWFNEGLAEYLEKMTFSSREITHRKDTYLLARVKTLIELREINLPEFVNWDYQKFASESFSQEGYGYAISYCMILLLMQQQDEEQAFAIFRNLIGAKSTIPIFDNCYKGGFAQFEKDFIACFSK